VLEVEWCINTNRILHLRKYILPHKNGFTEKT